MCGPSEPKGPSIAAGCNRHGVDVPRNAPTRAPRGRGDCASTAAALRDDYRKITKDLHDVSSTLDSLSTDLRDSRFIQRTQIESEWEGLKSRCGDQGSLWDNPGSRPPGDGAKPGGKSSDGGGGGGSGGGGGGGGGGGKSGGGSSGAGNLNPKQMTQLVTATEVLWAAGRGTPNGEGLGTLMVKDRPVRGDLNRAVRSAIGGQPASDPTVVEREPKVDSVPIPATVSPAMRQRLAGLNERLIELALIGAFARSYGRYLAAKDSGNRQAMARQAKAMVSTSHGALAHAIDAEVRDDRAERLAVAQFVQDSARLELSGPQYDSVEAAMKAQFHTEAAALGADGYAESRAYFESELGRGGLLAPKSMKEAAAIARANIKDRAAHRIGESVSPDSASRSEPADLDWLRELTGIANDALVETGQAQAASGVAAIPDSVKEAAKSDQPSSRFPWWVWLAAAAIVGLIGFAVRRRGRSGGSAPKAKG
jgi:hypothetical protein